MPITTNLNLKNHKDQNAGEKKYTSRNNSKGNNGMITSGRWSDTYSNSKIFKNSIKSNGSGSNHSQKSFGYIPSSINNASGNPSLKKNQ